ncbi:MAG: helix-turn-helix transcriptional regulator [Alphaproteobacteria bacterium]|nr:helix-turn-helix transcriptional regulator [Alphaproteobacteria bacterium]
MNDDLSITRGSGNVFLDIGFSEEEAAELLVKSKLIIAIDETIEKRQLSQKKAAEICHTDQPTLSKVLRGRMESVTIDRLASWLTLLGRSVEIHVSPYKARTKRGRLIAFPNVKKRAASKTSKRIA